MGFLLAGMARLIVKDKDLEVHGSLSLYGHKSLSVVPLEKSIPHLVWRDARKNADQNTVRGNVISLKMT